MAGVVVSQVSSMLLQICFPFCILLSSFVYEAKAPKSDKTVDTVGDKSFWDRMYHQRQKRTELFQWPDFKPFVLPRLQAASSPAKILMIGCGDSPLGADLFQDLNHNAKVVGVDYSEQAIIAARNMHAENYTEDQMSFVQLDIKEIDRIWASQGRDLIDVGFDKGTFDCFREDDAEGISQALRALDGALTPSGTLFIMSHETEEGMRKWLEVSGLPWVLKTEILTSRILHKQDPGLAKLMRMQLHRFDKGDPSVGPPNLDWVVQETEDPMQGTQRSRAIQHDPGGNKHRLDLIGAASWILVALFSAVVVCLVITVARRVGRSKRSD